MKVKYYYGIPFKGNIHEEEHGLNFAKSAKNHVTVIKCKCGAVFTYDYKTKSYISQPIKEPF